MASDSTADVVVDSGTSGYVVCDFLILINVEEEPDRNLDLVKLRLKYSLHERVLPVCR